MHEITRKRDTGEPGNGGQFGHSSKPASGLALEPVAPVLTTLSTDFGQPGNYCQNPTIDVEILDLSSTCDRCGGEVRMVQNPKVTYVDTRPRHVEPNPDCVESELFGARVRSKCRFCGTDGPEHLVFKQQSYSDETHCGRCGGIDGFGIGD